MAVLVRATVVIVFLALLTVFAVQSMSVQKGDTWLPLESNGVKKPILDRGHELFNGMNDYFLNTDATAYGLAPEVRLSQLHTLMITCGLLMDITVLSLLAYFACFGSVPTQEQPSTLSEWRIAVEMLSFYGFRFLVQSIFVMELPDGFYWDYPGFYSIVVPYGATNDFFYSGHIGCCMICFLEYRLISKKQHAKQFWNKWGQLMAIFALVTMVFQLFVMELTRGHYTIDMIAGLIFGHYIHMLVLKFTGNEKPCQEITR